MEAQLGQVRGGGVQAGRVREGRAVQPGLGVGSQRRLAGSIERGGVFRRAGREQTRAGAFETGQAVAGVGVKQRIGTVLGAVPDVGQQPLGLIQMLGRRELQGRREAVGLAVPQRRTQRALPVGVASSLSFLVCLFRLVSRGDGLRGNDRLEAYPTGQPLMQFRQRDQRLRRDRTRERGSGRDAAARERILECWGSTQPSIPRQLTAPRNPPRCHHERRVTVRRDRWSRRARGPNFQMRATAMQIDQRGRERAVTQ